MSRDLSSRPAVPRARRAADSRARGTGLLAREQERRGRRVASRYRLGFEAIEPRTLLSGTVTGVVFQDYNANGRRDTASNLANTSGAGTTGLAVDAGLAGVTVSAFDAGGVNRGTATTAADGTYSLSASGTGPYRVQFSTFPSGYFVGPQGTDSHSAVQFVGDGNTSNVSLGLVQPNQYSPDNPTLIASTYVYGDPVNGANAADPVLVAFPYNAGSNSTSSATGYTSPTPSLTVAANKLGTTWGLSYDQPNGTIYAAAYMKRHAGFGPGGTGAIYGINAKTGAVSLFADLNAIFGAGTAGADPHDPTNYETDNGNATWNAVGKISLGGLDVSPDGRFVYVMNLTDRSLYVLPTSGPLNSTTIQHVAVPLNAPGATGTNGADLRPFAVRYDAGQIYVGMVNSAESTQNAADLQAYVYKFDPTTLTFGVSPVFQMALNYPRGQADPGKLALWNPWSPTFKTEVTGTGSRNLIDPQPELTGLAFDAAGNMTLGIRDRTGDQGGNGLLDNPAEPSNTFNAITAGDTLRAFIAVPGDLSSGWTLESNGRGPAGQGTGPQNTGLGPSGVGTAAQGGGPVAGSARFYYAQNLPSTGTATPAGNTHDNVAVGGVLQLPGFPDVAVTTFDPAPIPGTFNAGGVRWFNNNTGGDDKGYQIYQGGGKQYFAKADGMGGLAALSSPAPIEIGDRVWLDSNGNGIQDPGEAGIAGVTAHLYQGNTLVGTTTTDSQGIYLFNAGDVTGGLLPNTAYQVRLDQAGDYAPGGRLAGLALTRTGADPSGKIGSKGVISGGYAVIPMTTGGAGSSDPTNDFGFLSLTTLSGTVFVDANDDGLRNGTEGGVNAVALTLSGTDDLNNTVNVTAFTNAAGAYSFPNLRPGTYTVTETPPTGYLPGATNTGSLAGIPVSAGQASTRHDFAELNPSSLAGTVYIDANDNGLIDGGESGLGGVLVTLTGTDDRNQPVNVPFTTNGSGAYQFPNLRPGTYAIDETQPTNRVDGKDTIGTPGGSNTTKNQFSGILLAQNVQGTGNNFGERATADLSLSKTVDNATPNVGDTITFTVTLDNAGPDPATGVTVADLLPNGLAFVSASQGPPAYDSSTGVWSLGSVANGGTATLTVLAKVVSPDPLTNVAQITGLDQVDPTPAGPATATETPQRADLSLSKSVDNAAPNVGDTVAFTVTLTNAGPDPATNVAVSDLLPAGLTYVSSSPGQSYDSATGLWSVGSVANGGSVTLTVLAKVTSPAALTNAATVTHSDQYDPTPGDTATATETPQRADLSLSKSVDNAAPNVGDTVAFTVTLTNAGPDQATNVAVSDLLPAGLTYVSSSPGQSYDSATGLWSVGSVANGGSVTLTVLAKVTSPAALTNAATVTHSDQYDPTPGDTATATETPQRADLSLSKSVDNAAPNVGDTVAFTVTLTNAGPDQATGVAVTDLLPAGLAFLSATPTQGSYDPATGLWTVGPVANGGSAALTVLAKVTSPAALTNAATVTHSDQYDPTPGDTATATETPQRADLSLTKSVDNAAPNVGDTVAFTVTLTNAGPDPATNVAVSDLLPAGLSYLSSSPSQGTYDSASGLWAVGRLADGGAATLTVVAKVVNPSVVTNSASVSHSDQYDPTPGDVATAAETPQRADLSLAESVDNAAPNVGDTVTFTVTLDNAGPDTATHVAVSDLLPAGLSYLSSNPSQGSYDSATGEWDVGTVANGGAEKLQIVARVSGAGVKTDTAQVTASDQYDPNSTPGNNNPAEDDQASVTVTPLSSVSGTVYVDSNADGVPQAGEPRLSGVSLTLSGTDDRNQPVNATTVTADDGSFRFSNTRPGTYTVTETPPAAYSLGQTTPGTSGGSAGQAVVTGIPLGAGVAATGYNFAERGGTVGGRVLIGTNAAGTQTGLGGVAITLLDAGGKVVATTTSAADGTYAFPDLPAGNYVVVEAVPNGLGQSTPVAIPAALSAAGSVRQDFAVQTSTLTGHVYVDGNDDGVMGPGESGVGGVPVTLAGTDGNGQPVSETVLTAADGSYTFHGLLAGSYRLSAVTPAGRFDGTVHVGTQGGQAGVRSVAAVPLQPGAVGANYDFAVLQPASIRGSVYFDWNRDGVRNANEFGIASAVLTLTGTDDHGSPVSRTVASGADGGYAFDALRPGVYSVTEQAIPLFLDGKVHVGTQAGVAGPRQISAATLKSGTDGQSNDFAEKAAPGCKLLCPAYQAALRIGPDTSKAPGDMAARFAHRYRNHPMPSIRHYIPTLSHWFGQ